MTSQTLAPVITLPTRASRPQATVESIVEDVARQRGISMDAETLDHLVAQVDDMLRDVRADPFIEDPLADLGRIEQFADDAISVWREFQADAA